MPPEQTGWADLDLPPLARAAALEPTSTAAAGALPDTAFRLTSLDGSDPATIAARVEAEPAIDLRVSSAGQGVAMLTPAAPLRPGQAYRFSLRAPDGTVQAAWAVQTVAPLQVATTVPADRSTGVPRDTGIELTFDQDGVDLEEARPFITIDPPTPGRFSQAGRTIAFAPSRPLARAALYRVTVRHGLPLHGTSMKLERDLVFAFETGGRKAPRTHVTFAKTLFESGTADRPVLTLHVDGNSDNVSVDSVSVRAHRLGNLSAAIDDWRTVQDAPEWASVTGSAPVATSDLPQVLRTKVDVRQFDPENDWSRWIRLPRLDAGWYVVTMTWKGVPRQAILQVTDVAPYVMTTTTRTLVWVNDVATGQPLTDARVGLDDTRFGATDRDGLVVADTPPSVLASEDEARARPPVVTVRSAGRGAFVPVDDVGGCSTCEGRWRSTAHDWWVLFQPDRYRYRSDDTMNVWGVARARETLATPKAVEVRLVAEIAGNDDPAPIAVGTASPDPTGSFLVNLRLDDIPYGQYRLRLRVDGATIAERSITVGPIVKPAWTLEATTDRTAALDGDVVRVSTRATFFEGTPVAGARLRITGGTRAKSAVSDSSGSGTAQVRLAMDDWEGQWDVRSLTASPREPQEGLIEGRASVALFRANVLVRAEARVSGGRLVATGSVNRVAWARFDGATAESLWEVDPYGAAVAGRRVRVRVVEHRDIRVRDGSVYDFITKRTVPRYEYETRTRELFERTVRTNADGRYRLAVDVNTTGRSFSVTATATDAQGNSTWEEAWASGPSIHEASAEPYLQSELDDNAGYEVGDPIRIRLTGGEGDTARDRYLWTVSQAGLQRTRFTSAPRFESTFGRAFVPGIDVSAVRFTGSSYEVARPYEIAFDPGARRLSVRISADANRYAPGGHASLTVRTRDASGTPVPATVFVRVVDEKLYALGIAGDEDPLPSLYQSIGSGVLGLGWTHQRPDIDEGEGGDTGGGDGDGGGRSDFRDWLLATQVRTDVDGRATVGVDLSDDLTSWRATASGITDTLEAGTGTTSLPVGLPFFAEATVAPEYLTADRPVIAVRGYGDSLDPDDVVRFTVSSDTLDMAPTTVRAKAFLPAEVRLPALPIGTHRITIHASTGTGAEHAEDRLVRSFDVVASRQRQTTTTSVGLTEATPVEAGGGITTLVLSDAGRGRAVPILRELGAVAPLRADRALAAGLAQRVLRDDLGLSDGTTDAAQDSLAGYQQHGGISILPYASGDLELSVLAAMTGDPRLDLSLLRDSFAISPDQDETVWGSGPLTRERRAWLLAGRAATGLPALADIRSMATEPDLTVHEQVALSIAALAAGDEDLAGRLERQVLDAHGASLGPWVRVRMEDQEQEILLTARLAIVAASLGDPVAVGMESFVAGNPPKGTVLDLERGLAARGWVRRLPPADASAFLTVDGARSEIRILGSVPEAIALTAGQARSATVEPGTGSVVMTTTFDEALDASVLVAPSGLEVKRTVRPGRSIAATDLVVVTFTIAVPRKPDACWVLTDLAPSGLVPVAGFERYDEEDGGSDRDLLHPTDVVGQRVTFCVPYDKAQRTRTARYLARVVTAGEYRWEPALVQSAFAAEQGATSRKGTIEIRPLVD